MVSSKRRRRMKRRAAEDILPIDCWEKIFSKVDEDKEWYPISSVCKTFLSITNRMRRKLNFFVSEYDAEGYNCPDTTAPESLHRLMARFPGLVEIHLIVDHFDYHYNILKIFGKCCAHMRRLQSLHFRCRCHTFLFGPFTTTVAAAAAVDRPSNIGKNNNNNYDYKISLKVVTCSLCKADDRILRYIGKYFAFIENLYVSNIRHRAYCFHPFTSDITDKGIEYLASKLKFLKNMSLIGQFVSDRSLVALSSCTSLTQLSLIGPMMVTPSGIGYLIAHCPNLVSLLLPRAIEKSLSIIIQPPPVVSSFTIENSVGYQANLVLQSLELPSHFQASDLTLSSIARAKFPLTSISFNASNCTLSGLRLLLDTYCQSLSSLRIRAATFLTDVSLATLPISFFHSLTEIGLIICPNLTFSSFLLLIRNCPSLTSIEMISTGLGTGDDQVHTELYPNENVQRLTLLSNWHLDDQTLESIGGNCPNLQHLSLGASAPLAPEQRVTCEGIAKILKRCSKIRVLHLFQEYDIPFKPNMEISELPYLEELYLRFSNVNDESLASIGKTCPNLRHLDLEYTTNITASGVADVINKCKRLEQISIPLCAGNHRIEHICCC